MSCSDRSAERGPAAGFTVVELLIVVLVIGLAITAASPSLVLAARGPSIDQSSRVVVGALREARASALAGLPAAVRIDVAEKRLVGADGSVRQLSPSADLKVTALQRNASAGAASIVFYPDGSASGGRILMSGASGAREVLVNWATGRAAVRIPQ